ncbi:MAG: M48 family metallopeptidase [Candidatus Saccharibacteria bacterium]|nr:M48 family metallopeptidase [Candidatus Saccharibacteria bacterium]
MILQDDEFGEIIIRKNPMSRSVRFTVAPSGRLQMSVPACTSDFLVKRFLKINRDLIREKIPLSDPRTQRARDAKKKILMKQARDYLPYRLEYLAKLHGYQYDKCRLSHAATRWGSCSSNRTISLNIGLMQVPEVLRDYVILHELAHLNHMDHSAAFWAEVATHDPRYKDHRKKLKMFNPGV